MEGSTEGVHRRRTAAFIQYMTMDPRVTVLMTVYNGEKYLKECIGSVLGQDFKDFEFLIIDDRSTDRSKDIIKSYKDDRICFIENEKNLGQVKSLNIGLCYARGAYVARMDQDDVMTKDRLKEQVSFLDNNPDICVAGAWGKAIDEHGAVFAEARLPARFEEMIGSVLFGGFILIHPSVIFRKDPVIEAGRFDESLSFSEDFELWTRLLLKGYRIANIQAYLIRYRCHRESSSKQFSEIQLKHLRIAISNFINVVTDKKYSQDLSILSNFLINAGLMKKDFWLSGMNTDELSKVAYLLGHILEKTAYYFDLGWRGTYLMKRIFLNRILNFTYYSSRGSRENSKPFYSFCLKNFGFLLMNPKLYLYPIKSIL